MITEYVSYVLTHTCVKEGHADFAVKILVTFIRYFGYKYNIIIKNIKNFKPGIYDMLYLHKQFLQRCGELLFVMLYRNDLFIRSQYWKKFFQHKITEFILIKVLTHRLAHKI